jgi:hypothetical protein
MKRFDDLIRRAMVIDSSSPISSRFGRRLHPARERDRGQTARSSFSLRILLWAWLYCRHFLSSADKLGINSFKRFPKKISEEVLLKEAIMKVPEPNPLFVKSRGDTPIGLMEIVRRGAQGVYGVSRSPPHFCNEATFGEKIARKFPFSLHFEVRFSKEYSFAKPLKNRCRRNIGDFPFWCRLPDSDRRPTDYKGGLGPCGCVAYRSKLSLFFPSDVGFPCRLCSFVFQIVPTIRPQLGRKRGEKFLPKTHGMPGVILPGFRTP